MNTHTAYTGKRDPINCPANQPKPAAIPPTEDLSQGFHDDQPKPTGCTCMADAYCKVHGNTPEADRPKPTTGRCACGGTIYSGGLCERCLRESLPPCQLKPTTDEILKDVKDNSPYAMVRDHAAKSLDKPTTSEWTAVKLRDIYIKGGESMQPIASAINAALDAAIEQKRLEIWAKAPDQPDIQEAVIKKLDLVHRHAIAAAQQPLIDGIKEALSELLPPAKVEKARDILIRALAKVKDQNNDENHQLATAIAAAQQPLVDALNEICNELGAAWAKGVRDRAFKLAKVKEGK